MFIIIKLLIFFHYLYCKPKNGAWNKKGFTEKEYNKGNIRTIWIIYERERIFLSMSKIM